LRRQAVDHWNPPTLSFGRLKLLWETGCHSEFDVNWCLLRIWAHLGGNKAAGYGDLHASLQVKVVHTPYIACSLRALHRVLRSGTSSVIYSLEAAAAFVCIWKPKHLNLDAAPVISSSFHFTFPNLSVLVSYTPGSLSFDNAQLPTSNFQTPSQLLESRDRHPDGNLPRRKLAALSRLLPRLEPLTDGSNNPQPCSAATVP